VPAVKLRALIAALAMLVVVGAAAALNGCSKDKGTNPVMTVPESFSSGDLVMGSPFTHTFMTAGTYAYRCIHHSTSLTSGMVGTVIVDDMSSTMGAGVSVSIFSGVSARANNRRAAGPVVSSLVRRLSRQAINTM